LQDPDKYRFFFVQWSEEKSDRTQLGEEEAAPIA
jgi:hypothetical protein